ncbi:sensor domain-containing diguanylate cyclase [Candidatus Korobacter versatilis]|nr:diguanylate cyclase [Candidatus Koribacter versatilis]
MQKIAILYDASQAVLSTFQLDEVLNQILAIVRDYFHLEGASVLLFDKDRTVLRVRLSFGKQPSSMEVPLGKGLTGAAVHQKRPIYSPDVTKDKRYICAVESTRSELAIPLMVRDEVVGVLDCQSDQVDFFDTETEDLLTLFATQASIGISNAKIYSLEQKRALQMSAIGAIASKATASLKLEELLVQLCMAIATNLALDGISVLTCEPDGTLILRAQEGSLKPVIETSQALLPEGNPAERALSRKKPVVLHPDLDSRPVLYEGAGSELMLPLVSAGKPLGMIVMGARSDTGFPEEDMQTLVSVADICATAIQNAFYFQQVEALAYVDGLTGVYNRRFFERKITEELERAARYEGTLSVIMVDIDNFKKVNDEFGHLLGDEVLRTVAQIFAGALRKPDHCCRYGGEEFSIILPETSGPKALKVAEKLRGLIADYDFPGIPRRITISAGVADFPTCGTTRDDIVGAADNCLYLAKQSGRNCVMSPYNMNTPKLFT